MKSKIPGKQPKYFCVYRFYDKNGELLYIGKTCKPIKRIAKHRSMSDWFGEVAYMTVEHFKDYDEALLAETRAIGIENPLHNLQAQIKKKYDDAMKVEKSVVDALKKEDLLPEAAIIAILLYEVKNNGGILKWARKHNVNHGSTSHSLDRRRKLQPNVTCALGYRRVIAYQKIKQVN